MENDTENGKVEMKLDYFMELLDEKKSSDMASDELDEILTILFDVTKKDDKDFNEYLEPNYDYQITEKIKEAKGTYKSCLGFNYSVEIDGDDVLVKNVNEQQSLFGEE